MEKFTANYRPICLQPGPTPSLTNRIALTSGWGIQVGNQTARILQKLPRRIIPGDECLKEHNRLSEIEEGTTDLVRPDIMLCTSIAGERDTCLGDSGGPWAVVSQPFGEKVGSRWTLAAVTSWGKECTLAPGVGARVTERVVGSIVAKTLEVRGIEQVKRLEYVQDFMIGLD